MSIFDFFQKDVIKEPTFIKEDNSAEVQLENLEKLLLETPTDAPVYIQIQRDIKLLRAGISGENNVAYELKSSFMPIYIFHDLFLQYHDLTAQIDYLVVHKNFILVIECKKLLGDIEITSKGDFIRIFKTTDGRTVNREGIYSPIVQNERHCAILKQVLPQIFPKANPKFWNTAVKSVVVVANPKSVIRDKYAKKEIKSQIIKYDQLKQYMQSLAKSNADIFSFRNDSLKKLCDTLLEMHKENPTDYTEKYCGFVRDEAPKAESMPIAESENTALSTALKQYRLNTSRKEGIKPYYIFNNAQMEEMIELHPKTIEELMQINGFAEVKCKKYGNDILEILNRFY